MIYQLLESRIEKNNNVTRVLFNTQQFAWRLTKISITYHMGIYLECRGLKNVFVQQRCQCLVGTITTIPRWLMGRYGLRVTSLAASRVVVSHPHTCPSSFQHSSSFGLPLPVSRLILSYDSAFPSPASSFLPALSFLLRRSCFAGRQLVPSCGMSSAPGVRG